MPAPDISVRNLDYPGLFAAVWWTGWWVNLYLQAWDAPKTLNNLNVINIVSKVELQPAWCRWRLSAPGQGHGDQRSHYRRLTKPGRMWNGGSGSSKVRSFWHHRFIWKNSNVLKRCCLMICAVLDTVYVTVWRSWKFRIWRKSRPGSPQRGGLSGFQWNTWVQHRWFSVSSDEAEHGSPDNSRCYRETISSDLFLKLVRNVGCKPCFFWIFMFF